MRIAIMGSGGIGGLCGARLAAGGADVLFLARGAHLEAMRASGLRLTSILGDITLDRVEATDDPRGRAPADLVLFTVKGQDSASAMDLITPLVGPRTGIVSLQNGVEGPDRLAARFGGRAVIAGTTMISAIIAEPGVIQHVGKLTTLTIGELDGVRSERVTAFQQRGKAAGLDVVVSDDIQRDLWWKFVGMASLSAVTSLSRLPMRTCAGIPETRALMMDAMKEVIAIAKARGVSVPEDTVDKLLGFAEAADPKWKTSMCTDLEAGKTIEIETISGSVHRLGRELGVPTPVHSTAYRALKHFSEPRA